MSSVLLRYRNFGLGDQILLSPIAREYCKRYERVGIFCAEDQSPTVEFMFRDLTNLTIYKTPLRGIHDAIDAFLREQPAAYDEVREVAIFDPESPVRIEKQFYKSADVPYEQKWDGFYVERDSGREQALWHKIQPPERFIFLHDDGRYPADPSRLPQLPIVRPQKGLTDVVFDYCLLIERASEVHVMDSSFMFLIDALPYDNPGQKLFVHRYARPNPGWMLPVLKKPWTILT